MSAEQATVIRQARFNARDPARRPTRRNCQDLWIKIF